MSDFHKFLIDKGIISDLIAHYGIDLQDKEIIYNKRGIGYFLADDAYVKISNMRKEEFIQKELPNIFKTIKLLNIDSFMSILRILLNIYREDLLQNHYQY